MSLFETLSQAIKPEELKTKASIIIMSHLSDAQDMCYRGDNALAIQRINFVKYVTLQCGGNLTQEINPDAMWNKFIASEIEKHRKALNK